MLPKIHCYSRQGRGISRLSVALVVAVLAGLISLGWPGWLRNAPVAQAQGGAFDSGSDESDGALSITTPGSYIFDPRTFNPPLDLDGDNVYHFTTITIGPGVTVTLRGPDLNMKPVYWLASGVVQIEGTIDLSGGEGHPTNYLTAADRYVSIPGPGGYPGGIGGKTDTASLPQPGRGPGGGTVGTTVGSCDVSHGGRGAGYATAGRGQAGPSTPEDGGPAYGNSFLAPLMGGSGGGGGAVWGLSKAGGGGAGGGALLIASSVSIDVNGSIIANGGNGGSGSISIRQGNGGGGSGGAIHLLAPTISGTGTLRAAGGAGGTPSHSAFCGSGITYSGGFAGSVGRLRLEAFQNDFTGSFIPKPTFGTPVVVSLPSNWPLVRVVNVAGVSLPNVPGGEFGPPDVTINSSSAVTLTVEARNVPPGSIVNLYIYSENGEDQIIDSTPLAGTLQLSTATISATVPYGPSRMFVRSAWTP